MTTFHFIVSQPAHFDHLAPIAAALPPERLGTFFVRRIRRYRRGDWSRLRHPGLFDELLRSVEAKALARGFDTRVVDQPSQLPKQAAFLAAWSDDLAFVGLANARVAFVEHGVGQTYLGLPATARNYAGADGRDNVRLFLNPNDRVTGINQRYRVASETVGVPRLDELAALARSRPLQERGDRPTVALSFHWEYPESHAAARWLGWPAERCGAFSHYRSTVDMKELTDFRLVGHSHPHQPHRIRVRSWFERLGVPFFDDFEDVVRQADVYVCDNSSTIFEFAALGRPVVVLNAPWYRKEVQHGLRFWEYADVGPQAESGQELASAVALALRDPPEQQLRRRQIVEALFPHRGAAAERCVEALLRVMG